jgi:hypothetical protein
MSGALMAKRAETMVLWYRSLPEPFTPHSDNEIGMILHGIASGEGWAGPHAASGNGALVRSVRRWIDHQREGDFAEIVFGTRAAGSGKTYSHMRDGAARLLGATVGTTSQAQASEHHARAQMEQRARESFKWEAESKEWFDLGEFRKAMVCHDAANDIEKFGVLQPATRTNLVMLGLL